MSGIFWDEGIFVGDVSLLRGLVATIFGFTGFFNGVARWVGGDIWGLTFFNYVIGTRAFDGAFSMEGLFAGVRCVFSLYAFRVFTNAYISAGRVTFISRGQGASFDANFGDYKFNYVNYDVTYGTKINLYSLGLGGYKELCTRGLTLVEWGFTGRVFFGGLGIITRVTYIGQGWFVTFLIRGMMGIAINVKVFRVLSFGRDNKGFDNKIVTLFGGQANGCVFGFNSCRYNAFAKLGILRFGGLWCISILFGNCTVSGVTNAGRGVFPPRGAVLCLCVVLTVRSFIGF